LVTTFEPPPAPAFFSVPRGVTLATGFPGVAGFDFTTALLGVFEPGLGADLATADAGFGVVPGFEVAADLAAAVLLAGVTALVGVVARFLGASAVADFLVVAVGFFAGVAVAGFPLGAVL
jgi:hypothetical protein